MLKHLQARDDWDQKSLGAKGFTLIELLVVIVILGVLAAVVIFAVGSVRDRAETNACKTDTKTLKTAIVAWNTEFLSGDNPAFYTTAYPSSEACSHRLQHQAPAGRVEPARPHRWRRHPERHRGGPDKCGCEPTITQLS